MLSKEQRKFSYDMGKYIDGMNCPLSETDPCIKKGLANGCLAYSEMYVFDLYNDVVGCQVLPDGVTFTSAYGAILAWCGSDQRDMYTFIHSSDFELLMDNLPDDVVEDLFEDIDANESGQEETVTSFLRLVK